MEGNPLTCTRKDLTDCACKEPLTLQVTSTAVSCVFASAPSSASGSNGAIVGAVLGAVVGIAVLAGMAFVVAARRRKAKGEMLGEALYPFRKVDAGSVAHDLRQRVRRAVGTHVLFLKFVFQSMLCYFSRFDACA